MSGTVSDVLAYDSEQLTIDNTLGGVALTLAKRRSQPPPQQVLLAVSGAPLRWLSDGNAPTASVGIPQFPTDQFRLTNRNQIENFRAIRTGVTSATLDVIYMR